MIELRHAMHREPELSNAEWKTQQRIREILQRFGINGAKMFHNTGLYVDIEGTASGPKQSIAVRGDIDALPIQETREDLSYRSQVNGVMHACGHDMHGSIALGTGLAFNRIRESFAGRVRVFFQPAEEAEPLGGRTVEQEGLLDGFDRAVGFHVAPDIPAGTFGAREGAVTKSADGFKLTITGKMSHGAAPFKGVDAIAIAAAFVNEVQKVVSREMPGDDGAVVTVGVIRSGEAPNIICPSVTMEGTIRTRSPERRGVARPARARNCGRGRCNAPRSSRVRNPRGRAAGHQRRRNGEALPVARARYRRAQRLYGREAAGRWERRFRLLLGVRAVDLLLVRQPSVRQRLARAYADLRCVR